MRQMNSMRQVTELGVFPIVDTILADVNAVIPNFSSLVSSYRLLVGAAEEIHRIPGVPEEIFHRAVLRFDHAGTLIDILLELLCCKIAFSSEFLGITCAPIDIFSLLSNCKEENINQSCLTAEQIIQLEILRRTLGKCRPNISCFGSDIPPEQWPPSPPPPSPSPPPPPGAVPQATRKETPTASTPDAPSSTASASTQQVSAKSPEPPEEPPIPPQSENQTPDAVLPETLAKLCTELQKETRLQYNRTQRKPKQQ